MSELAADDRRWLDAAVALAEPRLGTTADNPTVGAIVVDAATNAILGQGVTASGGRPHAEPQALDQAGAAARGATLYVTLEPCNHWGRTPPCADAVLRAGIARVVIGIADPDPRTAGESILRLRAAGLETVLADHEASRRLHEGHIAKKLLGRPFVTAKLAVSADGMIGRTGQANIPITGEDARRWTHLQRARSDAVLVGGATANIDNPQLTVRLPGLEDRRPLRLVLAGRERLLPGLNLFASRSTQPSVVIGLAETPVPSGIELLPVAGGRRPDLALAMTALGDRGIGRLLVEGGAVLTAALLEAGLVDRFHLLTSNRVIGDGGLPATAHGTMQERMAAAGFTLVDRKPLGVDNLHTFERQQV
ncbi:MAG TPA: bifunctional diaminohydroxyphosphoribosylaminopyrimidine deaminase/5-amino-6-(5-phosphoribosylamino)uracil reductase RibD [Devosiaceae bacterium]